MTQTPVPTLDFDGKQYPIDSLSDLAKAQINNIRATEQEIARLQVQLGVMVSRRCYAPAGAMTTPFRAGFQRLRAWRVRGGFLTIRPSPTRKLRK